MSSDLTSEQAGELRGSGAQPLRTRRRRRPWWAIVLVAVAVVTGAAGLVIQLLPNPADGPPVLGETSVTLRDNSFDPPVVQVERGATVTWSFSDGDTEHNVKGTGWGSQNQRSGTFRHTFTKPGSYRYSCILHARMNGRVDVIAG